MLLVGAEDTLTDQVEYLPEQHNYTIDSGTCRYTHFKDGNSFWDPVGPNYSITACHRFLLKYLDGTIPESGWNILYTDDKPFP